MNHCDRPADDQQRKMALDPTRSFAVAAPAGSGKTGLLTQRVLTLLAGCQWPEDVLAITFTNKAAAEMRHRIIDALKTAQSQPEPAAEYEKQTWQLARKVLSRDAELNWQLLSAPNRLRVKTIDGLCRDLARQLVLENGLGELPQPTDNADALYRETVQLLFSELLSDSSQASSHLDDATAALTLLLRHLDNNMQRLENLLVSLLARREQWLDYIVGVQNIDNSANARAYLEQQLQQTIEHSLQLATEKLQPFASDLALLVDYAASNLTESHPDHPLTQLQGSTELPGTSHQQGYPWSVLLELLLIKDGSWRKSVDVRCGFPPGKGEPAERKKQLLALIAELKNIPQLHDILLDIRHLPYGEYPQRQWQVLQALTTLLPRLSAQLSLSFLASNRCDFTEITLAALRALCDGNGSEPNPTDIALRLDYRIQHILIDEFQDTSSTQFQLLRRLTAGWQQDDGRTLFIVGDGMQSLYGFRSANVGLFLEARRHPIGDIQLQPLDLTVNFRSQSNVVEWVNQQFHSAFPDRDDIDRGAVRYNNSTAARDALPGDAITIDAIVDSPHRQREAEQVVNRIQAAKQQNPGGSIAVLVRNRNHLRDILPALYQARLNWQAIDIEPLSRRMAVVDVHSLTRALLSPADRIAWLSVLRAPWCGLQLADIHALATTELVEHNPRASGQHYPFLPGQLKHLQQIDTLSSDGRAILRRLCNVLEAGLQQRGRKPLRSWIEGIWLALGGPAALLDGHDHQHVRRYFDLLEQHSNGASVDDWHAFSQAVERLYAAPAGDSDNSLQLMTIHKSKGLEFDTVIIPGLDRSSPGNDSEILLWRERIDRHGHPQLLLGPLQAIGEQSDRLFEHLKRESKEKTRLENTRVMYVAATRAIQRLHLLFQVKTDSKQEGFKQPATDSLLAPLWQGLLPQLAENTSTIGSCCTLHKADDDNASQQAETPVPTLGSFARLPVSWQPTPIQKSTLLADYRGLAEGFQNSDARPPDHLTARHTGTLLHRTLQQIVQDGVNQWHQQRLEQQHLFWRAQLHQLGVAHEEQEAALEQLSVAIQQTLSDQKGLWLLDNRHTDSQCERPISYLTKNGRQRKAIVDRTFINDGQRWIIDYKSARPAEGQDEQAFIEQQCEHHRSQLHKYKQLFQQLDHHPVRLALYFPMLPLLVEIDSQK